MPENTCIKYAILCSLASLDVMLEQEFHEKLNRIKEEMYAAAEASKLALPPVTSEGQDSFEVTLSAQ